MGGINVKKMNQSKSEPNVVPLCDILLVLLIIFMVITPMIKDGVSIILPEAKNAELQPNNETVITVSFKQDGSIFVDYEEVLELDYLLTKIEDKIQEKKQSENGKILFKADGNIPYGKVTEVMEEIRKSQFQMVGLLAQGRIITE